jgi:hypothetical protein
VVATHVFTQKRRELSLYGRKLNEKDKGHSLKEKTTYGPSWPGPFHACIAHAQPCVGWPSRPPLQHTTRSSPHRTRAHTRSPRDGPAQQAAHALARVERHRATRLHLLASLTDGTHRVIPNLPLPLFAPRTARSRGQGHARSKGRFPLPPCSAVRAKEQPSPTHQPPVLASHTPSARPKLCMNAP